MDESERDPRNRLDSARAHIIPIAECAALSAHHLPRVRSLAAFGRPRWDSPLPPDRRHPKPSTQAEMIWMSRTFPLAPKLPDICVLMRIRPQRDYLLFHHQTRKEWHGDLGD